MDTFLHWRIKALLPFVPVLIPRSRIVYWCACLCLHDCVWVHPSSLGYSRAFLHDMVTWLRTSTFQSWDLCGDQWALLVSHLGFLFSSDRRLLLSFFFCGLPNSRVYSQKFLKANLFFLELAQIINVWADFTTNFWVFSVLWGLAV